ncbi:hypothetical protein [Pseudomonas sp. NFACC39-1]|uniref:hypothetical protein n=1 Tax=Pseudomonas sp. NFACC39-1 TaxID=1566195 RepID=UPI0008C1AB73|nr:hypothetical protein [Pseudomonas sp. NFACC39-1]SEO52459.1 hypothetical protein SAMN03159293_03068 [Pseudomonas sp. NFACC39-1]
MSAAQKLSVNKVRQSLFSNEFAASIDQRPPVPFRASFSRVSYPQFGDYLTITATLRDPVDNHIKTIRIIFLEDPVDSSPQRAKNVRISYGDTAENPPSEYSTLEPLTALNFDPQTLSISGTIDARVEDGLESPKAHELMMSFNLVAEPGSRRT